MWFLMHYSFIFIYGSLLVIHLFSPDSLCIIHLFSWMMFLTQDSLFILFIFYLFFLPFNSLCMTGLFSCENVFHIYFPPCDCYMINWFSYVILHDLLSFTFSHFHIIFVCAIWMKIALDDMIKTWADNSFSYIQRCIYVCSACAHY